MTITSPLAPDGQKLVGEALQASLVDLIDLALQAKQAHWNVVGPLFKSVHEHLDEVVDIGRDYSDKVAERAAAIAVNPDGGAAVVAAGTVLTPLPAAPISTEDAAAAIAVMLDTLSARFRERVAQVDDVDSVSGGLLGEILEALELQRWMFQSQVP